MTGGAGFLGSNMVRRLLSEDYEVVVVDNLSTGNPENLRDTWIKLEFHQKDISRLNPSSVDAKEIFDGTGVVFHFASQVSHITSQKDPYRDLEVNCWGTLNILEAMKRYCPDAHVIYSCSRSVYGRQENLPISEDAQTNPLDNYGITKLTAEKYGLLYNYHHGIKFTSLRMANLFGPRQVLTPIYQFIAYVFFCVMQSRPFTFYGDGSQTRDFLDVVDAVDAYTMCMENPEIVSGEVFNLGGKDYCTWNKAMEVAKEVTDGKILVRYIPHTPIREKLENPHSRLDSKKIAGALGWEPKTGLREGFEKMRDFYRKDDRWKLYLGEVPEMP